MRRREALVLGSLSSKTSTDGFTTSISTSMALWRLRLECLLGKSLARCDDAGSHHADSRSSHGRLFLPTRSCPLRVCALVHMRCAAAAYCRATLELRITNATTITSVCGPTKPRLIMQNSSRVLHRKTGLTYRRETQLSRVAQHTALIGGDREAAAGTRQVTNGSGSSATSACFFGSFISDAGFVEPR